MKTLQEEFGIDTCYVLPIRAYDKVLYSLRNSSGQELTVFENRAVAFASASQHNLIPHSVH